MFSLRCNLNSSGPLPSNSYLSQYVCRLWGWMARVRIPVGARFFFSLQCWDGLWGPPIQWVLRVISPGVKADGMNWVAHLLLVQRWRMVGLYLYSHTYLYGIVLNYLSKWRTLPFCLAPDFSMVLLSLHCFAAFRLHVTCSDELHTFIKIFLLRLI
jgi:hypothetical protein